MAVYLRSHMAGCQNYALFLGTLNIRGRIIIGTQKGTIILITTHIVNTHVYSHIHMHIFNCTLILQLSELPIHTCFCQYPEARAGPPSLSGVTSTNIRPPPPLQIIMLVIVILDMITIRGNHSRVEKMSGNRCPEDCEGSVTQHSLLRTQPSFDLNWLWRERT